MSQNIFSLEGLISWLETQDPERTFVYISSAHCLLTNYLKERGLPIVSCTSVYWRDENMAEHWGEIHELDRAVHGEPSTYGAALTRARELLAEAPQCNTS